MKKKKKMQYEDIKNTIFKKIEEYSKKQEEHSKKIEFPVEKDSRKINTIEK